MDENNNSAKKYNMQFIEEENKFRKFSNSDCISCLHKKTILKNNNTCFNRSNFRKDINSINNSDKKEYNNLLIINHKIITPIKIQNDLSGPKFLPVLINERLKSFKERLIFKNNEPKSYLRKNNKKQKFFLNKSYFSVDKLKIKKPMTKKNINKINLLDRHINNYNNSHLELKTTLHQINPRENTKQNFSLNNMKAKKSLSVNSINPNKKSKIKLRSKSKLPTYKSSNDLTKSNNSEIKGNLRINDIIINNNNKEPNFNNFINMDKKCNYTIRRYVNSNKHIILSENLNSNNNEEEDIEVTTKKNTNTHSHTHKKNMPMYFSVYHFFDTNNLYFFIPNSKFEEIKANLINNQLISNSEKDTKKFEILENFYLPPAFRPRMNKWKEMPECITDTCKKGGFALIKNFDNCNLIWRLVHPNKMKTIIRNIHNNQKYNHFISTFHLGRKDNLYKHFKYYKKLFPEMFNYAPATYILPVDGPDFEVDYKKYKKALWIVKPTNLSRGRGVHLLKGEKEFKELYKKSTQFSLPQTLISRYIDRPHLLNNKKYDLRIYVLIASFTPLRVYLYNNGLVRFATEDYKRSNFDNIFIHLTNYSINKNNENYKINQNLKEQQCDLFPREETEMTEAEGGIEYDENGDDNIPDDDSNKWSLIEYRNYFKKMGKGHIMDLIWAQIEAIVVKTVISVSTEYYKNIFPNKVNNTFELYGFDILIDQNFKAWLIEVNVNPSLHCTSPLDLSIKTDLISDIFNIVGILPYNHNGNRSIFNYTMAGKKKEEIYTNTSNKNGLSTDKKNTIGNKKGKNEKNDKENFNNKMNIKSTILRNFDSQNLEKKLPEYDEEYYKKMLVNFYEEKMRSNATEFNLLFPLKNNIKKYGQILIKDNAMNDFNIVLWQHILTND